MKRNSKRAAVVGALTVLVIGGASYAAWLSTGTGDSATVTAGQASPLVVTPETPATGLYPTSSEIATFTVSNPNSYDITISTAKIDSLAVTGGMGPGCTDATVADVTGVMDADLVGSLVPAGTSVSADVVVSMGATSHTDCQLAVITPSVSVAGAVS